VFVFSQIHCGEYFCFLSRQTQDKVECVDRLMLTIGVVVVVVVVVVVIFHIKIVYTIKCCSFYETCFSVQIYPFINQVTVYFHRNAMKQNTCQPCPRTGGLFELRTSK